MKVTWTDFQSCIAAGIKGFLEHKRALGRLFWTEENVLRLLDRYLIKQGVENIDRITPQVLELFIASRPRIKPRSYNHLVSVVHRLFDWLVGQDLLPQSPLHVGKRRETSRRIPFIFNITQAHKLLDAAGHFRDNSRALLRGISYKTIFALLYGLGLRAGEVSRLCWKDVDLVRHLLVIRKTKFAKDRLVPFGPKIEEQLQYYQGCRRQHSGTPRPEDPVFTFQRNNPIHPGTISQTFHSLFPQLHIDVPSGVAPPRLHDLRHSFAVGTLLRWYRSGIDPTKRLIHLSTFLGHVDPASTAVYLTITADLYREANIRFEQYAAPAIGEAGR